MSIPLGAASGVLAEGAVIAGRYRVSALLGRGGAGAVYEVWDERSGRSLALKRLSAPPGRQALFGAQFEREYHTLCQLEHPSIIEVYDYGLDDGHAFYTMELLDGPELRELCPLPYRKACELLRDVASSLAVLHSRRLLHRDVSVRNVRLTASGRAKLLDFGAMMPIGPAKHTVGTPPFAAPEALAMQSIDARADLYSLGALAYYTLTGRYAYPARTFGELQAAFAHPPPAPRSVRPDVPAALEELVGQLLELDREARPASAAEVMERLSGIAGLPLQEHAGVERAYLVAPALIGRDPALHHADAVLRAAQKRGGCLLIEGEPGVGRSRVLDAAVLRAKLLGIAVARGDSSDGDRPYGLMRVLCAQLLELLPESAMQRAMLQRAVLGSVIDLPGSGPREGQPERRHVHAALLDFVRALAREQPIALAVDDVELIDEPSAALLAALGHGASKRKLVLLLTARTQSPPSPALALIREVAEVISLQPLSAVESETLLRSVFGDAERLPALAERAHRLSGGNPRWLMTLAEHLVDRGAARYEAGSWSLPSALDADALPESLAAALRVRAQQIPAHARELADALALTDPALLPAHAFASLLASGDTREAYSALDALLGSGLLVATGDRVRFSQPELVEVLRAELEPDRARALHARLAAALAHSESEDLVRCAHHLLHAGQLHEAIDRLSPLASSATIAFTPMMLATFEQLYLAACERGLPIRTQRPLRVGLVAAAALLGERERFARYAEPFLAELVRDGGLADYAELTELPPEQRLTAALTRAQQRHDAEPERRLSPVEAITELARLCSTYVGLASVAQDVRLLASLPDLTPLFSLSPALEVVQRLVTGMVDMLLARQERTRATYHSLLERIDQPDHAGLDPAHHSAARLGLLYLQGIFAAGQGLPDAPRWVRELTDKPGHRVNAWRVRMTTALMQGDVETAEQCSRHADLLQLQDGERAPFPGSWERMVLMASIYFDDVVGVKRSIARLERMARLFPGRRPTLQLARGHYLRLQGDTRGALELLSPVLEAVRVGLHPDWPFLAALHVQLLVELGRHAEAAELGRAYHATCLAEDIVPGHRLVSLQLGAALLELGRADEARALADRCVAEVEATGAQGCALGVHYEARAWVALALGDGQGFALYAQRCEREYRRGRNRALRARFERLMARARGLGVGAGRASKPPSAYPSRPPSGRWDSLPPTRGSSIASSDGWATSHALRARLARCSTPRERSEELARCVIEATGAQECLLFTLYGGGLSLFGARPARDPDRALVAVLERHLHAQLQSEDTLTAVLPDPASGSREAVGGFEPMILQARSEDRTSIAGLAALRFGATRYEPPDGHLLEAVAAALLDDDSADVVTRID